MDKGQCFLSEFYFPERLRNIMLNDAKSPERTEEIRLIAEKPLCVLKKSGLYFLSENGVSVEREKGAVFGKKEDIGQGSAGDA